MTRGRTSARREACLENADVVLAVAGVFALGWIADSLTGRRGLFGASLVSATGAACGWFLAVRVFGTVSMDDLGWTALSGVGAVVSLGLFYLFRNTR